jgi:hypothetical protein
MAANELRWLLVGATGPRGVPLWKETKMRRAQLLWTARAAAVTAAIVAATPALGVVAGITATAVD